MDVGLHVAPGGGGPPGGDPPDDKGFRKHGDDAGGGVNLTGDDEEEEEDDEAADRLGLRKAPFGMYLRRPPTKCRHCGEMKYIGSGLCLSLKCQDWSRANRRHSATFGLYELPNKTQGARKKNKGRKREQRGT